MNGLPNQSFQGFFTTDARRFYRLEDDQPGLIVARIEPGSSASTAGLKPFELITHIDDEPVFTVDPLEAMVASGVDMRLSRPAHAPTSPRGGHDDCAFKGSNP